MYPRRHGGEFTRAEAADYDEVGEGVAVEDDVDALAVGRVGDRDCARLCGQLGDQGPEFAFNIGERGVTAGVGGAGVEQRAVAGGGVGPKPFELIELRWYQRVEHDAPDSLRVVAQGLQREVGAVGDTVEVPFWDAECDPEV